MQSLALPSAALPVPVPRWEPGPAPPGTQRGFILWKHLAGGRFGSWEQPCWAHSLAFNPLEMFSRQQKQLLLLSFANVPSFFHRPTPEEALKWGDSLEKLLLHKCECVSIPSTCVCCQGNIQTRAWIKLGFPLLIPSGVGDTQREISLVLVCTPPAPAWPRGDLVTGAGRGCSPPAWSGGGRDPCLCPVWGCAEGLWSRSCFRISQRWRDSPSQAPHPTPSLRGWPRDAVPTPAQPPFWLSVAAAPGWAVLLCWPGNAIAAPLHRGGFGQYREVVWAAALQSC